MPGELVLRHPMGLVYADLEVRRETGRSCEVRFLVDSGATLSVLPWPVWHRLGLEPLRSMQFTLADGTTMRRRVSGCWFRFRGIEAPSPVILGQRRDAALLGTLTLEALGLVLNPFERTLRPMRMMLAASRLLAADVRAVADRVAAERVGEGARAIRDGIDDVVRGRTAGRVEHAAP